MDKLDQSIMAALESATDLPDHLVEPNLTDEIINTFNGRHSFLMKWAAIKAVFAVGLILFCMVQFFQQETMMAMIAYASLTILCAIAYCGVFLFIWIQMNHNVTVREIKRVELQLALLSEQLAGNAKDKDTREK